MAFQAGPRYSRSSWGPLQSHPIDRRLRESRFGPSRKQHFDGESQRGDFPRLDRPELSAGHLRSRTDNDGCVDRDGSR